MKRGEVSKLKSNVPKNCLMKLLQESKMSRRGQLSGFVECDEGFLRIRFKH
jgi:hypothetical protein